MLGKIATVAFYAGLAIWVFHGPDIALKISGVAAVVLAVLTLL